MSTGRLKKNVHDNPAYTDYEKYELVSLKCMQLFYEFEYVSQIVFPSYAISRKI